MSYEIVAGKKGQRKDIDKEDEDYVIIYGKKVKIKSLKGVKV